MRALAFAIVVLTSPHAIAKDDPTTSALALLKQAARCDDKTSPWRPWCIATEWSNGSNQMPAKTLVGITIELEDGKDVKQALRDRVSFSALAVGADGKVKLTFITPTAKGEDVMLADALMQVSAVFKGKAKTARLPNSLAGHLGGMKGTYKPEKTKIGWTWQGASAAEIRKVGNFWVVIERPAKGNGIFATVLTDAWEAKP
jgi:hypothetical protein